MGHCQRLEISPGNYLPVEKDLGSIARRGAELRPVKEGNRQFCVKYEAFCHILGIHFQSTITKAGLPARSLFREKVAIGTFLQNQVLKGSLICVKSPYFTNFH